MYSVGAQIVKTFRRRPGEHLSKGELSEETDVEIHDIEEGIGRLLKMGYDIEEHPLLGYRLLSVPDILSDVEIASGLSTKRLGRTIYSYDELESTNDSALRAGRGGEQEGALFVAERQTRGRGRLGRRWHSPRGLGIWMSLILRPKIEAVETMRITMLAGVAVREAVKEISGLEARLKWPNDVLIDRKKVSGILTETRLDGRRLDFAVVGIGVNVNHQEEDIPENLRGTATSLSIESGKSYRRAELIQKILAQMEANYDDPEYGRRIIDRWKELSDTLNRRVRISATDRTIEGKAISVDADGALIVEGDGGWQERILAGDIEYLD